MDTSYIRISELNDYIKTMFDSNSFFQKIFLKGEISNFKNHTRGHLYFTLKDETSRVSAVMFYNNALNLNFKPEDGMNVLVSGRVSVYPSQGTYQIYVEKMELDGIGNLYVEYEKLKQKLASEGLFDKKYKKPIPKYPQKIGIITASTGAAIKDILSTIKRRYPICETILFPTLVQGKMAAPEIVRQINKAQEYDLDLIICGRGGGSIEDLWAFNEEIVARAIFASNIPIISAVGHEVDITIADYVADLRAPTPTGAAEMAVPMKSDLINLLTEKKQRINNFIQNIILNNQNKVTNIENSYVLKNPMSLYELKEQKLDNLMDRINKNIENKLENYNSRLEKVNSSYILNNPRVLYESFYKDLDTYYDKINNSIDKIILNEQNMVKLYINKLQLLNPLNILERGYSIVKKEDSIIKSTEEIKINDELNIKLKNGELTALVKEIK